MLANANATPVGKTVFQGPLMGRYRHPPDTDIQGRPRVSVRQQRTGMLEAELQISPFVSCL